MPVGLLTLELYIPDAQSLKEKRQVLRSLKDRLRREFNVAVAELDHHDTWQRSVVGVVTISNEEKHVNEMLQKVLDESDRILGSFLIHQAVEIICVRSKWEAQHEIEEETPIANSGRSLSTLRWKAFRSVSYKNESRHGVD
jgi:uncharacterized protein